MARYPSSEWAPIAWMNGLRHYDKTQLTIHITAGEGDPRTIPSWRNGTAGSNFVIFRDGRTVQLSDSMCKSAADAGATHTISVECVGLNRPLTDAQLQAVIRLARDANALDGVPLRLAETSSDAGIGWHRLGVDGNFPRGRMAGRLQRDPRGVKTSKAIGKLCPTDVVINQIHDVILPALTAPAPVPDQEEDDLMVIYRAAGERTKYGVLAHNGGFVELQTKAEYDNLKKAGAREVWVEKFTLQNLITDVRSH